MLTNQHAFSEYLTLWNQFQYGHRDRDVFLKELQERYPCDAKAFRKHYWWVWKRLRKEYFTIEDMSEVSDLLSLRNIYSVKVVLKKYGGAVFIPIEVVLSQSGRNWNPKTFNPNRLWKQIETKSNGRLTREHFINC